jgi:hypothetical protein
LFPHHELNNFGAGGETTISPLVLVPMVIACLLILLVSRKYVIGAFLIPAIFIPMGQAVVMGGVHLRMTRILIIVAIVRIVISRFFTHSEEPIDKSPLDRIFILWAISYATIFSLRWGTSTAFFNQVGDLYDSLGVFFVLRFLIRDEEDIRRTIRALAVVVGMVAFCMLLERQTGRNTLYFLGGVSEFSEVRHGHVRAQGPFGHSILAGSFAATLIPLFIGLWVYGGKQKVYAICGIIAALIAIGTCGSSTPVMAIAGGVAALSLWSFREKMWVVRRGIVATVILLQIVMKSDVWWLIAHVDVAGGSTGWDRSALIDNAIHHFGEWWLLGTNNNINWGFDMFDLCVQYVAQAVQGGLLTLVLFLTLITVAFKLVGRARKAAAGVKLTEFFVWAIGAALFSHICSFFGSSYWDQTVVSWFVLLAIICAVSHAAVTLEERQGEIAPFPSPRGLQPAGAFHSTPAEPWPSLPRPKKSVQESNMPRDPHPRFGHRT